MILTRAIKIAHHPHFGPREKSHYKLGFQGMIAQLQERQVREFIFSTYEHMPLKKALRGSLEGEKPKIIAVSEDYPTPDLMKKYEYAMEGGYPIARVMPEWSLSMRFALDVLPVLHMIGAKQLVLESLYKGTSSQEIANFYEAGRLFRGGAPALANALLSTGDPVGVSMTLFASMERKLGLSGVFEEGNSSEETASLIAKNILEAAKANFENGPGSTMIIYGGGQYFCPGMDYVLDGLAEIVDKKEILGVDLRWAKDAMVETIIADLKNETPKIGLELVKRNFFSVPPVRILTI